MEELIRLLNIYSHSFKMCNLTYVWDGIHIKLEGNEYGPGIVEATIINKRFGFVEWLIANDKIEVTNVWRLPKKLYINNDGITCVDDMCEDCYYDVYESLLMLLAISDTPIKVLTSYLKKDD